MLKMLYQFIEWLHGTKKTNDDDDNIKMDKHKHHYHKHHYVQVKSSGKTLKEIIQMAPLDWNFKDLIITEKGCDTTFKYKGQLFFVNRDYLSKIYNEVCIHCGECTDYQSWKLEEIKNSMDAIDRKIEEEELAEKIYADKCMGGK